MHIISFFIVHLYSSVYLFFMETLCELFLMIQDISYACCSIALAIFSWLIWEAELRYVA